MSRLCLGETMGNGNPKSRRALDGVRVLDLTWLQVGPQATRLLASFGAQVIRIEWRERRALDFLRYTPPYAPDHARADGGRVQGVTRGRGSPGNYDRGAYFNNTNPGKYGVTLNLNHPKGRDLLRRMVRDANAICENFSRPDGQVGPGLRGIARDQPWHHLLADHRARQGWGLQGLRELRADRAGVFRPDLPVWSSRTRSPSRVGLFVPRPLAWLLWRDSPDGGDSPSAAYRRRMLSGHVAVRDGPDVVGHLTPRASDNRQADGALRKPYAVSGLVTAWCLPM